MQGDASIQLHAGAVMIFRAADPAATPSGDEGSGCRGSVCAAASARGPAGLRVAQTACVVGLLFAAVSVYWGLAGTWLLDTVLGQQGRPSSASVSTPVLIADWAGVVLKMIAPCCRCWCCVGGPADGGGAPCGCWHGSRPQS